MSPKTWLVAGLATIGLAGSLGAAEWLRRFRPDPVELGRAVTEIEGLDLLRSSLAGTFAIEGAAIDRTTFEQVCRPVGLRAREIAQKNGWQVSQLAEKYRNPAHAPDEEALWAIRLFSEDEGLVGVWRYTRQGDELGARYFRRIVVEGACLACHGPKEQRPAFVKEGYPDDRAYDFEVGDLRGVYSVFVPFD